MPWLSDLKGALQRLGKREEPQPERWPATGLAALYGVGCASTPARIKDISTAGIYLFTQERLPPGEPVVLSLRKEGEPESSSDLQFSVQAQVASQAEDGIELSFVQPPGTNLDLWGVLIRNLVVLTDPEQVAETFRILRATLFLCRLCPSEAEEAILLLDGQLDADRTATLFKILFAAADLLAAQPDATLMRAHPKLVANILRQGSWASDEPIRQLWTGLLASSCSVEAPEDSNQIFVDQLVHMTPTEAKILVHACERALGSAPGPEIPAPASIVLSPTQIIEVTGVYDLYRNAIELNYLFNLGLIKKAFDFTSYHDANSFDITPSRLGLELYMHCHGRHEKLDPHLVEMAKAHLAIFHPSPQPSAIDSQTPPSRLSSS